MSKKKQFKAQDEQDEQEILAEQDPVQTTLDYFFAEGMITEVRHVVKSGKEATVYCCTAHPLTGVELLAAKIYRPRNNRGFKNDAIYREGRVILNGHDRRAVQKKTSFGREAQFAMWVNSEFGALKALYQAGADIPKPIARTQNALLMEYVGDHEGAAPALGGVELTRNEAHAVFERVMGNIELWLAHNFVHADLSAYNILYWQKQVKVIDFPQTVDPRFNPNALMLLTRDIENVCRYVARFGVQRDGQRIATNLWRKFKNAEL